MDDKSGEEGFDFSFVFVIFIIDLVSYVSELSFFFDKFFKIEVRLDIYIKRSMEKKVWFFGFGFGVVIDLASYVMELCFFFDK